MSELPASDQPGRADGPDPLLGQVLDDRYRIIRVIAVGGLASVYEAMQIRIGKPVAIKVLRREMASDPEVLSRFMNEVRAVGAFEHPNIVGSSDFGELPGGIPYLVLEYLEGQTLAHEVDQRGPLSVRRAVRIALQIASALETAHSHGVIHRDLTSSNVFLTHTDVNPDHVKVLDFGISKFLSGLASGPKTRRGLTMGTPEFMAPEQISDPESVGPPADIYALGVMLYQMLCGHLPFGPLPLQELLTRIVLDPMPAITRPDVPDGVRAIIMRALAKRPADRFSTMGEMGIELERFGSMAFSSASFFGRVRTPAHGIATQSLRAQPSWPMADHRSQGSTGPSVEPTHALPERGRSRAGITLALAVAVLVPVGLAVTAYLRPQRFLAPSLSRATPMAGDPPPPAPVVETIVLEINSHTPMARVTFRGKTHPVPFANNVLPGSQPELLELTAPGHEGRRLWATLDHPLRITTDLPAGHGVKEAKVEASLVAVPEGGAEETPATADRVTNKRVATTTHHAGSRTKSPVATIDPEAPHAALPRPSALEAAIPAAVAPSPVVKSEPVAPPAASPLPETKGPPIAAATTAAGAPRSAPPAAQVNTVDAARTGLVVRGHLPEIQRCYERGRMDDPELRGRVTVRFTLSALGSVAAAQIESSSLSNGPVESCILDVVRRWTFPAPAGGTAVISYPFVLR